MKNVSFYNLTHPVVKQVLAEALAGLSRHLDGRPEFVLKFTNGAVKGGRNDIPIVDPVAIGLDLTALLHREVVGTPPKAERQG